MPMSDTTRLRKFIKRIDCTRGSSSCWPWLGRRNAKGYGVLRYQYQFWFAHRLAYTLWCGTIPPGFQVQHRKCDNPPCCIQRTYELALTSRTWHRWLLEIDKTVDGEEIA